MNKLNDILAKYLSLLKDEKNLLVKEFINDLKEIKKLFEDIEFVKTDFNSETYYGEGDWAGLVRTKYYLINVQKYYKLREKK